MNINTIIRDVLFEGHLEGTALFFGRMQPLTVAHYNIIDDARKKYRDLFVIIVAGRSRKNNPLTFQQREKLIHKAFAGKIPKTHIIKAPTGFTPHIVQRLSRYISKQKTKAHFVLFAGEDRADEYRKHIEDYYEDGAKVEVQTISREDESVSATRVRKALLDSNEENFKRLMPTTLWNEYDNLKKLIAASSNQLSDDKIIKT